MPEFVLEGRDHAARAESDFVLGYIEAMFFTESASGIPMAEWSDPENQSDIAEGLADGCLPSDADYSDLHESTLEAIRADCEAFQSKAADLLALAYQRDYDEAQAGRDFWFTRNGHGVGFWDRKELEADSLGESLSDIAREFGEVHVWFADHVTYGNLHWVHVDGSKSDKPVYMPPRQAWLYAASWGSAVTGGDPGAVMYGFDETCRVQSESHRADVLAWVERCRADVLAKPENYDSDELEKMRAFVAWIERAPVGDATCSE